MRIHCRALALWLTAGVLALPAVASAAGGSITGTVRSTPPKYLPETVVYLVKVPGRYPHRTATIDQKHKAFVPHVLAITAGDTVIFENHDHIAHNVFSPEGNYNLGVWGFGETKSHTFTSTGVFAQLCSLHPEMLAYVFVGQNPYAAVVDAQGHFTIKDVPPGRYQLAVWNSHLRAAPHQVVTGAGTTQTVSLSLARK